MRNFFSRKWMAALILFMLTSSCEDKKYQEFGTLSLSFEYTPTVVQSSSQINKGITSKDNNNSPIRTFEGIEDLPFKNGKSLSNEMPSMKSIESPVSIEEITSELLQDYSIARITINNGTPVSINLGTTTSYNRTVPIGTALVKVELLSGSTVLYQSSKSVQIQQDQSSSVTFKSTDWTVENQEISITDGGFSSEVTIGQSITFTWTNTHAARPVRIQMIQVNENNVISTLDQNFTGLSYTYNTNGASPANNLGFKVVSTIQTSTSSSVCCFDLLSANATPVANNISDSTDEDNAVEIQLDADDDDGDSLTYAIASNPSNGSLGSINNDKVTYTPSQDFNGTDTFTYKVNDGTVDSNIATVTVTVNAVNDAPITKDVSGQMDENRSSRTAEIALDITDVDEDNLTVSLVTEPSNGQASIASTNEGFVLIYDPNQDWNGVESFTYKANDGTVDSNTSTITITVNSVSDNPYTEDIAVELFRNNSREITLVGGDADGDSVTFSIVQFPASGSLSLDNNIAVYRPNFNFIGTDSFTYKASDGTLESDISTVSINVKPGALEIELDKNIINYGEFAVLNFQVDNSQNFYKGFFEIYDISSEEEKLVLASYNTNAGINENTGINKTISDWYIPFGGTIIENNLNSYTLYRIDTKVSTDCSAAGSGNGNCTLELTDRDTLTVNGITPNIVIDKSNIREYADYDRIPLTFSTGEIENITATLFSTSYGEVESQTVSGSSSDKTLNFDLSPSEEIFANDEYFTVYDYDQSQIYQGYLDERGYSTNWNLFVPSEGVFFNPARNFRFLESDSLNIDIHTPEINLLRPLNGNVIKAGESYTVNWNSKGAPNGEVRIILGGYDKYFSNDGAENISFRTAELFVEPQKSYSENAFTVQLWNTSTNPQYNNGQPVGIGSIVNVVYDATEVEFPSVTYPTESSLEFNLGETKSFTWSMDQAISDSVYIFFRKSGESYNNEVVTFVDSTSNSGSYEMTLAAELFEPGESYTFEVFAKERHPADTNSLYHSWFGAQSSSFTVNSISINSDIFVDGREDYLLYHEVDVSSAYGIKRAELVTSPSKGSASFEYCHESGYVGISTIPCSPESYWLVYNVGGSGSGSDQFSFKLIDNNNIESNVATVYAYNEEYNGSGIGLRIDGNNYDSEGFFIFNEGQEITLEFQQVAEADSLIIRYYFWEYFGTVNQRLSWENGPTIDRKINKYSERVRGDSYAPYGFYYKLPLDEEFQELLDTNEPARVDWYGFVAFRTKEHYRPSSYRGQSPNTYTRYGESLKYIINSLPIVENITSSVNEDNSLTINLIASDEDNDELRYTIVSQPSNGTVTSLSLSLNDTVEYTPDDNFYGEDSFTYQVSDGEGESNIGTVTITVQPQNDAPIAENISNTVDKNNSSTISLDASDVDGDDLTYSIVSNPSNGTLGNISGNTIIYTPNNNWIGTDSFTYKANDGTVDSNVSTVTISVNEPVFTTDIYQPDGTNFSMPQREYFELPFSINDQGEITDINIDISFTHGDSYGLRDTKMYLLSPNLTLLKFFDFQNAEKQLLNTTFDDEADDNFSDGSNPFIGSFKPLNNLSIFDGEDLNGEWKLIIRNNYCCSGAVLNSFKLQITRKNNSSGTTYNEDYSDFTIYDDTDRSFPQNITSTFTIPFGEYISTGSVVDDFHIELSVKHGDSNGLKDLKIAFDDNVSTSSLRKVFDFNKLSDDDILKLRFTNNNNDPSYDTINDQLYTRVKAEESWTNFADTKPDSLRFYVTNNYCCSGLVIDDIKIYGKEKIASGNSNNAN